MKITIINGSPKLKNSNSEILINYAKELLKKENENIEFFYIKRAILNKKNYIEIMKSNILLFVFPLYFDGIPSHLLQFLIELEEKGINNPKLIIYTILNNGFFEGKQNHIAIEQMKNWSITTNTKWGQGIGIGGGEMLLFLKDVPLGRGPLKNLDKALKNITENIRNLKSGENIYVSPNYPRFLFKMQGSLSWILKAQKNGVKFREL